MSPRFAILLTLLLALLAACGRSEPTPAATAIPTATAASLPAQTATAASPTVEPTKPAAPVETLAVQPEQALPPPTPTSAVLFEPGKVSLGLELALDGLDTPVFATHAGDGSGRLFVLEKPGRIVTQDQEGAVTLFLDIRERVGSSGYEQGLLGLAFHPDFARTGRFFLYYPSQSGAAVISSFQARSDLLVGDPASESILLRVEEPAANHNGGMIAFGPDGLLYAGLGDGGAANDAFGNGQNLGALLGTLIRLDVDSAAPYAIPADNPFVNRPGVRPEIWAYGLRNPWRFAFDRLTGELFIADVGQNQWEEVNLQAADSRGGENYGWPIMEGTHCFGAASCDRAGLVLPVAEYGHDQGCSITGGYVYRGAAQPQLQGAYFYGDFCSGQIWSLSRDAAGRWRSDELLRSGLQISSFGETEAGEVLVVDMRGAVYRLVSK